MKKRGKWLLSMALMVSLAVPVSAAPVNLQDVSAVEASADTAADEQSAETGVSSIEESAVGTEMTESAVGTETTESTEIPETKETEPETKKTEPETKETEPEAKKTEPETKETEPETKETEDNTKTDHELIGEMTKASVSLKSAKCQAFNTIKVEWQAAAGADADGYVIYRKTENSNWQRIDVIKDRTYEDTSVEYGQKYLYTVRAYKKVAGKEYLSQYDKKGIGCKAVPSAPKMSAKVQDDQKVHLSWNAIGGTDTYKIYEKDSQTGKWKELSRTKNTSAVITADGGQTHTYTVRAIKHINGKDVLSDYDTKGTSVKVGLAAPTLSGAKSTGTNSIQVSWKKVSSTASYRIYRKGGSDKNFKALADTANLNYTDKTATPGVTYTYTVKAYIKSGNQRIYSDYDRKGVSASSRPSTPVLKSAKSAGYNSVTVTWQAVEGATNYKVYRKNGSAGYKLVATTGKTSFTDSGLTCGTAYTYTVKAYVKVQNKAVESDYNKKGLSATPMLTTPTVKSAARSEYDTSVRVVWSKVQGADGYKVYRKQPGGNWECIQTADKDWLDFDDYSADENTVYIYTVRAYRKSSGKTWMSGYNRTGKYMIDQAELSSAINESGKKEIIVGWHHIKGVDGYYVYRKENGGGWKKVGDFPAEDMGNINAGELIAGTDSIITEGKYYTYTIRGYCKANGNVQMGSYDKKGVSSAYLKLKAEYYSKDAADFYFHAMNVRITNNSGKSVTFYNDAVFMRNYDAVDVQYMGEYDVKTGQSKTYNESEISLNPGKSKIIQYGVGSWDEESLAPGDGVQLQALFKYDGRYYVLVVTEDYAGFVGYDQ